MSNKHRVATAALIALVLVVPVAIGGSFILRVRPADTQDVQRAVDSIDWFTFDWTMDTIGQDWTLGTTDDPMATSVERLRVENLGPLTDELLPELQEKQWGIAKGTLRLTTLPGPEATFWIEPGNGWFPSLARDGDDEGQHNKHFEWAEAKDHEYVRLSGPCLGEQPRDMLADEIAEPLRRYSKGGNADGVLGVDQITIRDDRVGFGYAGGETPCELTLEFRLDFVHEALGQHVQTHEDTGYFHSVATVSGCVQMGDWRAGDECVDGYSRSHSFDIDVLYAPVFPLGWAMKTLCEFDTSDCCTDLLVCLKAFVDKAVKPSSGNMGLVFDGEAFQVFVFDVDSLGVANGQLFDLGELDHSEAAGTSDELILT